VAIIDAPVQANTLRFAAFGAGLVIVASLLAFLIARTVVRPLTALANSTRRFGDGDLSHRAAVRGPPESRRLATTFNKVAEELQERTERLIHLSEVDLLTGLPNRRRFEDALEEAIARCNTKNEKAALLFLDVDHFKSINDTLGHAEGDLALCVLANRLQASLHSDDLAARLGGDEFVVLLRVPAEEQALVVADHIRQSMQEPVAFVGGPLLVSVSVGIAMYQQGYSASDFLAAADRALYVAKSQRSPADEVH
jgi:diguanylate cyclase (GGDEF)-like protein